LLPARKNKVTELKPDGMDFSEIRKMLRERLGDRVEEFVFPPPVFVHMEGRFSGFDLDRGLLSVRFPVYERYLNPYGSMQGGMVAAAIDNTLGPLSVLVAPPNVTRHLEIKYSRPVTLEMGHIEITARLIEKRGRRLFFAAEVRDPGGKRLARARAVHWIMDEGRKEE
jgi:acyl-coenzyme A thioesterase PaaI-like protein